MFRLFTTLHVTRQGLVPGEYQFRTGPGFWLIVHMRFLASGGYMKMKPPENAWLQPFTEDLK